MTLPRAPPVDPRRFMEPQTQRQGETSEQFAERVRDLIATRAGLKIVPWDGAQLLPRPCPRALTRPRPEGGGGRAGHVHRHALIPCCLRLLYAPPGLLKYYRPSAAMCERQRQAFADRMKRHLEGSATPRFKDKDKDRENVRLEQRAGPSGPASCCFSLPLRHPSIEDTNAPPHRPSRSRLRRLAVWMS